MYLRTSGRLNIATHEELSRFSKVRMTSRSVSSLMAPALLQNPRLQTSGLAANKNDWRLFVLLTQRVVKYNPPHQVL